jgi:hypothetical protein
MRELDRNDFSRHDIYSQSPQHVVIERLPE